MRTFWMIALAVAVAGCQRDASTPQADAAPAQPAAAVADAPMGPTPGLWRVSTSMQGMPAGMPAHAVETCIREARFEAPEAAGDAAGLRCEPQTFRREGDAMVGRSVCTGEGMRTVSDIRVTGDFSRRYVMEVRTTMTPPPMPGMETSVMTMTAERLGDCPAGSAE